MSLRRKVSRVIDPGFESNEFRPSLANAELTRESPPVLEALVEGWRRLVESDTVRITDTLRKEVCSS